MASPSEAFWAKVAACKHMWGSDYYVYVGCSNRDVGCSGGYESRCVKCGVYCQSDPCGESVGMSGWSYKRVRANERKRADGKPE